MGSRPVPARSRSPLSSAHGVPLAWTFAPGAWPMIRIRDVPLNWTIGRGPAARNGAQTVQRRISLASAVARAGSEAKVGQARMVVGTPAERPVKFPVGLGDRQVVDARMADRHQPMGVEVPVLVAVATEPVAAVVPPLVGEAHRDPRALERPDLLDQPVVDLVRPLAGEE